MKKQDADIPRITLRQIISRFGRSLISDPKRCEALLRDLCPGYKRETAVLIAALKERVASDLISGMDTMPEDFLVSQLTRRLYENLGMAEEFGRWAVRSWLLALKSSEPVPESAELPEKTELQGPGPRKAGLKPALHTEPAALQDSDNADSEPVLPAAPAVFPGPDRLWWEQLNSRWKRIFRRASGADDDPDPDELSEIGKIQSLQCYTPWFPITDLEPLVCLRGLKKLNCAKTRVASLEPLASLTALEELICRETPVSDLKPLAGNLQTLDCSGSQVIDLEPLGQTLTLRELYCSNTGIRSLEPLRNLSALEVLDCDETEIRSLEPLRNLTNLRVLNCSSNRIGSLEPLRGLKNLRVLNCNFNTVTDLKALGGLSRLEILNCNENCISSLDPLRNLTALQILNFNGNPVSSLDPLEHLIALRKLGFEDTQVRSLKPLYSLTNLQKLYCRKSGAGMYEQVKFRLKNPLCEVVY